MTSSSDSELLDPRIKGELDRLNNTSAEINRLEREIDDIRHRFRHVLTESSQRLTETGKKCIKAIHKAHPYHEAKKAERLAHESAQDAALKYQRAVSMFRAAKETITIAEEASMQGANKKRDFDSALQEMLNHATIKLNKSEEDKIRTEKDHHDRSRKYVAAQKRVEQLGKKLRKSIAKTGHYFELRESFYYRLEGMKIRVEALQSQVAAEKRHYRQALKNLEKISDEIHQSRQLEVILAEERSRGVGADSEPSNSEVDDEERHLSLTDLKLDLGDGEKHLLPKNDDEDDTNVDEHSSMPIGSSVGACATLPDEPPLLTPPFDFQDNKAHSHEDEIGTDTAFILPLQYQMEDNEISQQSHDEIDQVEPIMAERQRSGCDGASVSSDNHLPVLPPDQGEESAGLPDERTTIPEYTCSQGDSLTFLERMDSADDEVFSPIFTTNSTDSRPSVQEEELVNEADVVLKSDDGVSDEQRLSVGVMREDTSVVEVESPMKEINETNQTDKVIDDVVKDVTCTPSYGEPNFSSKDQNVTKYVAGVADEQPISEDVGQEDKESVVDSPDTGTPESIDDGSCRSPSEKLEQEITNSDNLGNNKILPTVDIEVNNNTSNDEDLDKCDIDHVDIMADQQPIPFSPSTDDETVEL